MTSRRQFLIGAGAAAGALATRAPASAATPDRSVSVRQPTDDFDPWLEIDPATLHRNVAEIARLAGGRPVLGVVKNNAYGLGLDRVGPILDTAAQLAGLAVVKADEAIALRDAGVRKPILVMGAVGPDEAAELIRRDVGLAPFHDDAPAQLAELARRTGRTVSVHLDIDTGMNRVGMPHARAADWIAALARERGVRVEGVYTTFVEDDTFDLEQLARFETLRGEVRRRGIDAGRWHAASSHALFFRPDALLDMIRPGLVLYGARPAGVEPSAAQLRPAFRLRARVVRVERLDAGEGVSYGRNYVAERPTWIATLPVGHADGYPRRAVEGCEVLVSGRPYRVIGAVSASHTILEIGDEPTVAVGDVATLVGPDDDAVLPNTIAQRAGVSVYDVLMHLSARLPARMGPADSGA
jgi:alanine racemase